MKKIIFLVMLLVMGHFVLAQSAYENNIKQALQAQLDASHNRDLTSWKATWMHSPTVSVTRISTNGTWTTRGWDSLLASVEKDYQQNPKPNAIKTKYDNYNIRSNGNMALAEYDMIVTPNDARADQYPYATTYRYHVYQVLLKDNDQWKTTDRVVNLNDAYENNANHAAEDNLNTAGYMLLSANKVNEAIEVFKLNVKLYPASWNVYDSLGEAYAIAGNKKLAIENYEKSVKMYPGSESGLAALVKLKQK